MSEDTKKVWMNDEKQDENGLLKETYINENHCKCQITFFELRAYFKFKLKDCEL